MSAEEKVEADRKMKIARRQAELKMKNPETPYWKKYEEKIAQELAELERKPEKIEEETENKDEVEEEKQANEEKKVGLALFEKYDTGVEKNNASKNAKVAEQQQQQQPVKKKGFLEEKINATTRKREDRAVSRAERKVKRSRETNALGKYEL